MDPALLALMLTAVGLGAVFLLVRRQQTVFLLRIRGGRVETVSGRAPAGFIAACDDVCRLYGIGSGEIRGVRTGGGVELRFSDDIPERARQPFRNVWTPPPPGGGGGGMRASG